MRKLLTCARCTHLHALQSRQEKFSLTRCLPEPCCWMMGTGVLVPYDTIRGAWGDRALHPSPGERPPSHVLQLRTGPGGGGGAYWGQSSPCRRQCCGRVPECQVTLAEHKGAMCPAPQCWFLKGNDEWCLETTAQPGREKRFSMNTHENGAWIVPATAAAECRGEERVILAAGPQKGAEKPLLGGGHCWWDPKCSLPKAPEIARRSRRGFAPKPSRCPACKCNCLRKKKPTDNFWHGGTASSCPGMGRQWETLGDTEVALGGTGGHCGGTEGHWVGNGDSGGR